MASQFIPEDKHALLRLADLVDRYWHAVENEKTLYGMSSKPILEDSSLSPELQGFLADLTKVVNKLTQDVGKGMVSLAAEIRQQEARFGLTPQDRWRLQWKIEQPEAPRVQEPETEEDDPRQALRLVQ